MNTGKVLALLMAGYWLTGCGGGEGTEISSLTGISTNPGGSSGTVTTSSYTLTLSLKTCDDLSDPATCTASSHLPTDKASLAEVVLTNAKGVAVKDAIINATTTQGEIRPTSSRLTDSAGKVSFLLNATPDAALTAGTFTVTSTVDGVSLKASKNFEFGASDLAISLSSDKSTLSAGSVAVLTASVTLNGQPYPTPVDITFSSACASAGKATLDNKVSTVLGMATATYKGATDNNACAGNDTVTATMAGSSLIAQVVITNEAAAIRTITAATPVPEFIYIRGSGKGEAATITFTLKDAQDKPVSGKQLDFSFGSLESNNANYQDYALFPLNATTDSNGQATVTVNAGSIPVPLRVIATLHEDAEIRAASGQIGVGIGYPDDNSFSFSADRYNIDGACYDGREAQISIRLADRFNNPVPDGTKVYLTTEGGSVKGVLNDWATTPDDTPGTCYALGGLCRAVLVSQDPRPKDGRVTVTAYTEGEESFWDYNGNGIFDKQDLAAAGIPDDKLSWEVPWYTLPYNDVNEVFMNLNFDDDTAVGAQHDGYRVNVDTFMDLNGNGIRDEWGDTFYTGLLCSADTVGSFCKRDVVSLYRNAEFIFSGVTSCNSGHGELRLQVWNGSEWRSGIQVDLRDGMPKYVRILPIHVPQDGSGNPIPSSLGNPANFGDLQNYVDLRGVNPIPAGSTITATTDNGGEVKAVALPFGNCSLDYASAYPSTTRPQFICMMITPEGEPNKKTAGALEIRVTTPGEPHGQEDGMATSVTVIDNG